MQVLEREHDRLRARARREPTRSAPPIACGAVPPARVSSRAPRAAECRPAARAEARTRPGRDRSAEECSQGRPGAARRASRAAEPLAAPFGDRVQRRILQQLRRRPFDPGVRRLAELRAKLLDEPRLADAGLADDEHELALASRAPAPSAGARGRAPPRARRAGVRARAPTRRAAARAHDAKERHRLGHAFERMRAAVLGDKQPGGLPLNGRGDEHEPGSAAA